MPLVKADPTPSSWPQMIRTILNTLSVSPVMTGAQTAGPLFETLPQMAQKGFFKLSSLLKPTQTQGQYDVIPEFLARLKAGFQAGKGRPQGWSQSDQLLESVGGDETLAMKVARLFGATSPRTDVRTNTLQTNMTLARHLEGLPMDRAGLMADRITPVSGKLPNILRALADQPLSRPKAERMSQLMAGQPGIPIDTHAMFLKGAPTRILDEYLPQLRKDLGQIEGQSLDDWGAYGRMEEAIKRALTEEIAPGVPIPQSWGQTWEGARALQGLPPDLGAYGWWKEWGQLGKGKMLDPSLLRSGHLGPLFR